MTRAGRCLLVAVGRASLNYRRLGLGQQGKRRGADGGISHSRVLFNSGAPQRGGLVSGQILVVQRLNTKRTVCSAPLLRLAGLTAGNRMANGTGTRPASWVERCIWASFFIIRIAGGMPRQQSGGSADRLHSPPRWAYDQRPDFTRVQLRVTARCTFGFSSLKVYSFFEASAVG